MKEKQNNFIKKDVLILFIVLILALGLRLYKINTPLADFHSWRQVDTAAVARNFVQDGFNLFQPKYDDLSNVQSGQENPQGLRFVEFPLYNAMFASLYKYFPAVSLEIFGRLTSVFFSLIIIAVLYYFLLKESGRLTAIVGSLTYAVFPFFVFFSRVVLPETTALGFTFLSLFLLYLYTHGKRGIKNSIFYILSSIFFALGLLIKPTVIFYFIAVFYLFLNRYKWSTFKKIDFYLFFILSSAPLFLWRNYITQFPEGVPASEWLITSVNTAQGVQKIFFKPAFFRWIFFERINNLILGGFLTVFAFMGLLAKNKRYFLLSIFLSSAAYLLVFQGGNVQHEYYQILILPTLAALVGLGVNLIVQNNRLFLSYVPMVFIIFFAFVFSFLISFNIVKNYYNYPTELVSIAKIVKDLTKREDKIVTDRTGDTTLLYLSERRGAPSIFKDLDELKKGNYKYLVILDRDSINNIKSKNKYEILFENDKVAIFKL